MQLAIARQNSEKQAQELKKMELEKKDLKAWASTRLLAPLLSAC